MDRTVGIKLEKFVRTFIQILYEFGGGTYPRMSEGSSAQQTRNNIAVSSSLSMWCIMQIKLYMLTVQVVLHKVQSYFSWQSFKCYTLAVPASTIITWRVSAAKSPQALRQCARDEATTQSRASSLHPHSALGLHENERERHAEMPMHHCSLKGQLVIKRWSFRMTHL